MRVYATACDHLNIRPYQVMHAAMYTNIDQLIDEEGELVEPVMQIPDPYQQVMARLPIKDLVTMFHFKVRFVVPDPNDWLDMLHVVDNYVDEVTPSVHLREDVQHYLQRLLPFREAVLKRVQANFTESPDLAKAYGFNPNPLMQIITNYTGMAASPAQPMAAPAGDAGLDTRSLKEMLDAVPVTGPTYAY